MVSERTVDARPLFSAQGSFPQSLFVGTNFQRPRRRIRLSKQLSALKKLRVEIVFGLLIASLKEKRFCCNWFLRLSSLGFYCFGEA